jgi:hypothetical protein
MNVYEVRFVYYYGEKRWVLAKDFVGAIVKANKLLAKLNKDNDANDTIAAIELQGGIDA